MARQNKMTLKEKKKYTEDMICYKCKNKLEKDNNVLTCSKCDNVIKLSKY